MREIKFRAWNGKKIMEVGCLDWGDRDVWISKSIFRVKADGYNYRADEERSGWGALKDIVLMQYTGLKDKNGKEIYEGDIVYMEFEASDNETVIANETNVVIYEEAIASFVFAPSTKHRGLTVRDFWRRYKDCKNVCFREIIGNIYKNPELLK